MIKLGCISWSYRSEFSQNRFDLFSWMVHCSQELHLDGVELWNNHFASLELPYLARIRALAQEEHLELYSVASKCTFGGFSDSEIQAAQDTLRQWLSVASHVGAPVLRVSIAGNDLRNPINQRKVFQSLAQVIAENRYPGIRVGIENQEPGVVQGIADVELLNATSEGAIGLVLDNGSFVDKGQSYEFMERTIPFAAVIHLKFFDIDTQGADKVLDYGRIVPLLKRSGYKGFVSIEYDGPSVASRDVPLIAKYLREQLKEGGQ